MIQGPKLVCKSNKLFLDVQVQYEKNSELWKIAVEKGDATGADFALGVAKSLVR